MLFPIQKDSSSISQECQELRAKGSVSKENTLSHDIVDVRHIITHRLYR